MDEVTLNALINSVFKWEQITFGYGADLGESNCALCELFLDQYCIDCPMNFKNIVVSACQNTSYSDWDNLVTHEYKIPRRSATRAKDKQQIDAAKAVWHELLSLLPESIE